MKKALFIYILGICMACVTGSVQVYAQAWVHVGRYGFVTNPSSAAMAIDTGGTPYVVATNSASVMKFTYPDWVDVGAPVVPWSGAANTSIAIDKNGVPYVVYVDYDNSQKATVAKYNGSSWVTVGIPGFTINPVVNTVMAIDTAGTPYVAYTDYGYAQKVTVMKFDGTNWVAVGSPGFSAGASAYISMAISKGGTPYVVYEDVANNNRATVMAYNGSSWATVGSPAFSDSSVQYTSIAIDTGGTPYVAYQDAMDNLGATVMKYTGTGWVPFGSTGFSGGGVEWTSIAIDKNDTFYVAYIGGSHGSSVTVMKYVGDWFIAGNPGFSEGATYCSLAIDNNGIPYVLYHDVSYCSVAKLDTALSPITGATNLCAGATIMLSDLKSGGTWSTKDTSVISINSSGLVTGLSFGEARISYTKAGYATTFTVFVDTLPFVNMVTYGIDSICPGDSVYITAEVYGSWGSTPVSGIWSSMDTSIATITALATAPTIGLLKGKVTGSAVIKYIVTNDCGTDTTAYSFPIGSCSSGVKNITAPLSKSLSLFPNPATASLSIESTNEVINQVSISNIFGQTVFSDLYHTKQVEINVSTYPAGMYFVKVNNAEVRKFVKQ